MRNASSHRFASAVLFAFGLCAAAASPASAASGVVSGVLLFYQKQGNFCPSSRDCSGAKYTYTEYETNQPMRDARVYVTRRSDKATLGEGVTDAAGFFTIAWYDPSAPPFNSVLAHLEYRGEHSDGRFYLATREVVFPPPQPAVRSELPIDPLRSDFTATSGFQWLNFPTFGDALTPNHFAQLHDGANKMWRNSLSQSFLMTLRFNDLEIQAFNEDVCVNSCAVGARNVVVIGQFADSFAPQGRVMHEMGHIASYLSNPSWDQYDPATFQIPGGSLALSGAGWTPHTAEYESAGWDEAFATHLADVGLYYPSAAQPYTCYDAAACPSSGTLSLPLEPTPNCSVASSNAIVGNHVKYHWDNYDTTIDYVGETLSRPVYDAIDTLADYPATSGEGGIDEAWNLSRTAVDDLNGRSTQDFRNRLLLRGFSSTLNLATNCGSAGD